MKKTEALNAAFSKIKTEDYIRLKSLERGTVYQMTGAGCFNNCIVRVSHFYKEKLRLQILSVDPKIDRFAKMENKSPTISIRKMKMRMRNKNIFIPEERHYIRSLNYTHMYRYTFTKIDPTDLPLYLGSGTQEMEHYLRKGI